MKNTFMFKFNFKKTLLIALAAIFLSAPAALAAGILPPESGTAESNCSSPNGCGNYSLNDFIVLAVNVSNWILGLVGSVALLFFVYGGFVFIFSGGNEETVKKGKQILLGSVIGLFIVFASYLIIQFSMTLLGVQGANRGGWSDLNAFINRLK